MSKASFRAVLFAFLAFPLLMGTCDEDRKAEGKTVDSEEKQQGAKIGRGQWELRSMKKEGERSTFDHSYRLRIKNDSAIGLTLKVNDCYGSYKVLRPGKIRVGPLSCTEMCCDPEPAKELARQLSKVDRYERSEKELLLLGDGLKIRGVPVKETER